MTRPRTKQKDLPPCLYFKHGRFWFVRGGKWIDFGVTKHGALTLYADAYRPRTVGGMEKLLDEFLDQSDIKESTRTHYRSAINSKIKPAFVQFSPGEVESTDVAAFLYHHKKTPNMANRMRTILKCAFDLAVEQGIAKSNPVISTKRNKEKKRDRFITDAEFLAIHAKADDVLRPIMEMAFYTGQRIGDVLKMRRSDIRQELNAIYVKQTKGGKEVFIEISPEVAAVLANKRAGNIRSMFLFSQRSGKQWSYKAIYDRWMAATEAAGVEDANIHDMRAKGITEANRQGLDAQQLAGHTSPTMTERYIRDREIVVVSPPSFRQLQTILDGRHNKSNS